MRAIHDENVFGYKRDKTVESGGWLRESGLPGSLGNVSVTEHVTLREVVLQDKITQKRFLNRQ